jgi:hypothetical protein
MERLAFTGKLVKNGSNSFLYKSKYYPDIKLFVYINQDTITLTCECDGDDIASDELEGMLSDANGDLDIMSDQIDKEYGNHAPGFDDEIIAEVCNETTFSHLKWNPDRQLVIYTWGKRHHKNKPVQSQCNFNAAVINGSREGLNLKKMTGLNKEVQKSVKAGTGYIKFMEFMINKIESNDLQIISLCCTAGRHRCVSCAEILKSDFYPNAVIYHLDISR